MFTVKIDFNPSQVIQARGLNKNGSAQQYFTKQCYNHMEKYVPYKTGMLRTSVNINTDNLVFTMPYARKQFYTNMGNGTDGINKGGLRGPHWSKRMWNNEGNEILNDLANKVGGHL